MGHAIQILSAIEKVNRWKEFKLAMRPWADMLYKIYSIMPHPGYIIKDGVFEPLPPTPEWQEKIDLINRERSKYILEYFPEFYNEDNYGVR